MKKSKSRFTSTKPAPPRQDITYSLAAETGSRLKDKKESFAAAIDCSLSWLGDKAPFPLPDQAKSGESFTAEDGGYRIECVSLPEREIWTARFSHPDMGIENTVSAVAGRHWTTDIAVEHIGELAHFSIRVACASPAECCEPVCYVRPAIIPQMADQIGLSQVHSLTAEPWILREPAELDELEALLTSTERRLPVFLATQPDKRKWTHTPQAPHYLIDGYWLAKQALGYAHVVLLPFNLGYDWTRKVGSAWSAFDGAVRVYFPGLKFDEDMPKRHRVFFKEQILSYSYNDQTGRRAFTAHAADIVKPYNAHRLIAWQEIPFVPRARSMFADLQIQKINDKTSIEEVKSRYEKQVAALRTQLAEAERDAEQWSDEAHKEREYREYHEEENGALRGKVQMLSEALQAKTGSPVDEGIRPPESYAEIPDWVQKELAGRLVLHPRAIRTLKDAKYEDPQFVAKSLLLLANEYRNHRTGRISLEEFENAKNALHLTCKGSITEENAGEYGETYYVRYPVGSMRRCFLKWHLCNGTSREARHCMRIYFFWDQETKQVVVGSLPAHLENQIT